MKSFRLISMAVCLCLMVALGAEVTSAKDKKITKKQLPAAVLTAFQTAYPHATIKGQSIETEKGKKFYEIESVDGKINRDLLYTAEGKVYEIEETVAAETLPEAVKSTLAKEYPKGKIVKAEKVTHDTLSTYEIHLKIGKKTKGVSLDLQGKILKGDSEKEEKGEKDEEKEDD
ncbi:MAG: PepSY-like domain-containing protein [Bacteroidota bacterium]